MKAHNKNQLISTNQDALQRSCAPSTTALAGEVAHHSAAAQQHSSLSIFCEGRLWYYEKLMGAGSKCGSESAGSNFQPRTPSPAQFAWSLVRLVWT